MNFLWYWDLNVLSNSKTIQGALEQENDYLFIYLFCIILVFKELGSGYNIE